MLQDGWVTVEQAARVKGTSRNTLHQWLKNHKEVTRRKIGNVIVLKLNDLDGYNRRLK